MSDKLAQAIVFASVYHSGQKDKQEVYYIFHPLRVMMNMQTENEKIVAVLHDVLEDTDAGIDDIRKYFGDAVANAVIALTRGFFKEETYMEYLERVSENPIAKNVKVKDILDNSGRLTPELKGLEKRYAKALAFIGESK